ncbi:MAG TPA: cobalamin-binding protein [Candidatus Dormibacteraeota bacterium]|nr:cobalamin-binding protein [Candidatus Dormibacteraeota bacterium]
MISAPRLMNILLMALFLCTVHARLQSQSHTADASASREFVDETGRTVRVPQAINRIVSLAPSLTETLYALGLQDRLVGDTDYCDYPPDAQKKTKVGGGINPSIETIASLHPDLVLVTKNFNRLETVETLKGLGIPSYATEPHNVRDIISSTEKIAELMGAPEAGKSVAEDMQKRLSLLQEKLEGTSPRRILFVVWSDPLISIGKDTFIADALRLAGAVSIVDSAQSWPQMNLEEMVKMQPDYLVFASSHSESVARDFDVLARRPGWRLLDAVRNRRFAVISDAVNRPAPRIVSAIEELARQLHPELFQEHQKEKPQKDSGPAFLRKSAPSMAAMQVSQDKELVCAL